ncbi:MAG: phosphate ABC transporter substrate-binding protein [Magnetococcales bacterium]|nr:phosphate ABC transporter substrate-binding protein [Magnetococcales bacterium]
MRRPYTIVMTTLTLLLTLAWSSPAQSNDDSNLIRIKGSDTLAKVTQEWRSAFLDLYPDLTIDVHGGGSGNGIAALLNGHVEIANTSRKLRAREKRLFARRTNLTPHSVVVGLDAVSILVHPDNPLNGISLAQLARLYGVENQIKNWSDLGVSIPSCESGAVVSVSRKNNSGTYLFFKQTIFQKRAHFHNRVVAHWNSKELVDHVAKNPCAIGYSGMSFIDNRVKTLCVSGMTAQSSCVPPTATFTLNNSYPLSRPLFMYTAGEPTGNTLAFLNWIQSEAGQDILQKVGFVSSPTP